MDCDREWLTQDEVAASFGITTRTVRNLIREGHIKAIRLGPRLVRIPQTEIERLRALNNAA